MDAHRARRETATQLLNLTSSLPSLYGLTSSNPLAWAMGKAALESMIESCDRLTEALPRYEFSLPKRQSRVVGEAIRAVATYSAPLNTQVLLYEKTGILDQEREKGVDRLRTAPYFESVVNNALYEIMRAYTALMLTRRRPLKYHLRLRHLAHGAPPLPDSLADDHSEAEQEETPSEATRGVQQAKGNTP